VKHQKKNKERQNQSNCNRQCSNPVVHK
jgi:hypothetical protein